MKVKKILLIIIFVFLVASSLLYITSKEKDVKILIIGTETYPFEFYNDSKIVGIDIDFIDRIFSKMNIDYEIKMSDWETALSLMKSGDGDLILGVGYSEEREEFLSYTDDQKEAAKLGIPSEDALWVTAERFFYKPEKTLNLTSYESIKENGYRVGIVNGYHYFDDFWNHELNFYSYKNVKNLIEGLMNNEIDLIILDSIEGRTVIKNLGYSDKITSQDKALDLSANYLVFSKKYEKNHQDIKENFYKELIRLKKEENLHNILYKKYLNQTFTEIFGGLKQ